MLGSGFGLGPEPSKDAAQDLPEAQGGGGRGRLLPESTWSRCGRLDLVGEPGLGGDQGRRFQDSALGPAGGVTAS